MFADVTRDSFDAARNYLRVLAQQGRALLDADFNEQAAILHHWLTQLTQDLRGEHWGPSHDGFKVQLDSNVLSVTEGRYYVAGLPCEVHLAPGKTSLPYTEQENYPNPERLPDRPYLVYLDVWERHLTAYEEKDRANPLSAYVDPFVRDPGLGHIDTTTRTQVVWQIRAVSVANKAFAGETDANKKDAAQLKRFKDLLQDLRFLPRDKPLLAAQVRARQPGMPDPCHGEAEMGYLGRGNQLYRVEIHDASPHGPKVTFKWAVDNASATYPIEEHYTGGQGHLRVVLRWAGRDLASRLKPREWVELIDDAYGLRAWDVAEIRPLLRVLKVSSEDSVGQEAAVEVTLEVPPNFKAPDPNHFKRPLLRRWAGDVQDVPADNSFVGLCDGVEVGFQNRDSCRRGDYWLIPARPATKDILWLRKVEVKKVEGKPDEQVVTAIPLPPRNPPHAYAPLLLVPATGNPVDLRRIFEANDAPPDIRNWLGQRV